MRNIKLSPGISLLASLHSDPPTADEIKDMVYAIGMQDFSDQPDDVLNGLVEAYVSQATYECEGEDPPFEVLDSKEAEQLYMKYAVMGYRSASGNKTSDDSAIYEACDWYEDTVKLWPDQLLAEIAFAKGYKAARTAKAYQKWAADLEAKHGPEWYKHM